MVFTSIFRKFFKSRKNSSKASVATATTTDSKEISSMSFPDQTTSSNLGSKDGFNFQYKNGRRFQNEAEVSYVLPNDYDELDRVHQQHWMLKCIAQGNFHAPVEEQLKKGITVLDSGCGPATWTLDMAETYPNSKFYGVDASLVFPQSIKPANTEFVVANIAKEIPFPDNTFDFIYQRLLIFGLTTEDWDKALKELLRVLKPGGYIEFIETDSVEFPNSGPMLTKIQDIMTKMLASRNMAPHILFELEDRLIKAGFDHKAFSVIPIRVNGKDKLGQLAWEDYRQVVLSLRPVMAQTNPEWEDEEAYKNYVEDCASECIQYKTVCNFGYHYAIKPI